MREPVRAARRRALAPSLAALLSLAACSPETVGGGTEVDVEFRPVAGTWAYTASEVRLAGAGGEAPCRITGMVLEINQFRNNGRLVGDFDGRASGGTLDCRGELSSLSGAIQPFAVGQGYTFNEYVSFNIGTRDWRHDGFVAGDSMSGTFVLRQGSLGFEGRFVAKRTAR